MTARARAVVGATILSTALALPHPGPATAAPAAAPAVERVAGPDRYATAVAAARRGWVDGAPTVVLVGGRDFRDAVAGAALAGALGRAPVLSTPADALRDDVRDELVRLGADDVIVVGGEAAVGAGVEAAVASLGARVARVAGEDATATAAAAARHAYPDGLPAAAPGVLLVHPGDAEAATAAAGPAAAGGIPVLFAASDSLPQATADALASLRPSATYVVADPAVVADAVVASVPGGRRVDGTDGYDTAVTLAELQSTLGLGTAAVALASAWPDAVAAAPLAARLGAALLLTDPVVVHGRITSWYRDRAPAGTTVVGGDVAIDPILAAALGEGIPTTARGPGSSGPVVAAIQDRMTALAYHPSTAGAFDPQTTNAVYALQKVIGRTPTGAVGDDELRALQRRVRPTPLRSDVTTSHGDHVEISIGRQLLQVVKGGVVVAAAHTSTGKPSTPTIVGLFRILDHRPGFNAIGMYMTMHFRGGYAIHGYDPVPLHPASHGCARVIHRDAEWLYDLVPDGMPVIVWR